MKITFNELLKIIGFLYVVFGIVFVLIKPEFAVIYALTIYLPAVDWIRRV